jgi:hypothetical protein
VPVDQNQRAGKPVLNDIDDLAEQNQAEKQNTV